MQKTNNKCHFDKEISPYSTASLFAEKHATTLLSPNRECKDSGYARETGNIVHSHQGNLSKTRIF